MIKDYNLKKRYKVTGEYDVENKVMYFDLATAEISTYRQTKDKYYLALPKRQGEQSPRHDYYITDN